MLIAGAVRAQDYPPPPTFAPQQLDSLVAPIALYPDPLLAQVLAAATFPDQIQDAAQWANEHRDLHGDELADAIAQADLPWDPSVQALIPFPDVLDRMSRDMNWTSQLGDAVLAQHSEVMDAVQRMRREAESYGYLRSNDEMRVVDDMGYVQIMPYDPAIVYVPVYDPYVVYAPPRPGFYIGSAIRFSHGFRLGVFTNWGWGGGFNWRQHAVIVNRTPWQRNWTNRHIYVHSWNNWDNGRWHPRVVQHNVIINNPRPRREVVINPNPPRGEQGFRRDERSVTPRNEVRVAPRPDQRTYRAPEPRTGNRSEFRNPPERNQREMRNTDRGRAPEPAPNRSVERRSGPERPQVQNHDGGSRDRGNHGDGGRPRR